MRIKLSNQLNTNFSNDLLDIGNGVRTCNDKNEIVYDESICQKTKNLNELIEKIFPNISSNYLNSKWISDRTIITLRNDNADTINEQILHKIPGDEIIYESIDSTVNEDEATMYPTEFLNSLNHPGIPNHKLKIKIGTVIMLMRNLNPPTLCNGTKLLIKKTMKYLLEAEIITGQGTFNVEFNN